MTTNKLVESATVWLSNPIPSCPKEAIQNANALLTDLQSAVDKNRSSKQIIGPLLGKVKAMQKRITKMELVNWVAIGNGHLAIGHRPSTKLTEDLKLQNGTHILTLLSENEGAEKIKTLTAKSNLNWLWLPMESAKPIAEERTQELGALLSGMKGILEQGGKIYLHCSAGIHRTGMITYAFLRFTGLSTEDAMQKLKELRPDTYEGVGEERTAWGEEIVKKLKTK
ncbi:protein-tyrosine phosphatase [Roseivirga ehrenbergii]|uniref:Tyrosine specific protein phosphatases domain-containing protein n=1 Tax=Roseivirga ehrenbergii (strain DSM 102268 / JCM 13514 / KCTC 12282 / NCIMB 14502 / KMM 6017) TaxID=279360 RepID=A0A150WYT9_ROSEK|nr:dual specificity protein phosphatase family protein [Roseivirga ehrenbergii]KYG71649.1 hypothetical protein MB14_10035 [Roseivirga ehrenbergii]TCL07662.1 protein-tyrosine phosphatase [Roseivirga ehrenbergii]